MAIFEVLDKYKNIMTESNKKYYIWAMVVSVLLIFGILFLIKMGLNQPKLEELIMLVPTTVTIELIFVWFFTKWIWKWKILHSWFVVTPDLSGKWKGTLHYVWNEMEDTRDTTVTIIQSFNHIVVNLGTVESKSRSVAASFDIDERRNITDIYYTYINEPKVTIQDRSKIHYGTARLTFDLQNPTTLIGEYWTSRGTKGEMYLEKI